MAKTIRIQLDDLLFSYAEQEGNNWCWAASIQMVFNYHGIKITQNEIVRRTHKAELSGKLPDTGAGTSLISSYLNNWTIDSSGTWFFVTALFCSNAPMTTTLITELEKNKPLIIVYQDHDAFHAVVLTGVEYIPNNNDPCLTKLIIRDPWPDQINRENLGRKEFLATKLTSKIVACWTINVEKRVSTKPTIN